jgi:hypothetical protein
MNDMAGIWIDHRKAFVVTFAPGDEHTALILSRAEKHPERSGDSPLEGRYEAHSVPADASRQRALTGQLNDYYDAVIATIRGYDNLFIFGPGEAKGELLRRLVKMKVGEHVTAVEAADDMTDREIVAKVRRHFGLGAIRPQAQQPA